MSDDFEKPDVPKTSPQRLSSKGPGRGVEGLIGCLSYFGMLGIGYLLLREFQSPIAIFAPMIILAVLAIYFHLGRGWRGFAQGVFLGLGLSCLIGVPVCFYAVAHA